VHDGYVVDAKHLFVKKYSLTNSTLVNFSKWALQLQRFLNSKNFLYKGISAKLFAGYEGSLTGVKGFLLDFCGASPIPELLLRRILGI
jgi:hypothetical protein